jgi:hypothetical protein
MAEKDSELVSEKELLEKCGVSEVPVTTREVPRQQRGCEV